MSRQDNEDAARARAEVISARGRREEPSAVLAHNQGQEAGEAGPRKKMHINIALYLLLGLTLDLSLMSSWSPLRHAICSHVAALRHLTAVR